MSRRIPFLIGVVIVLVAGIVNGARNGRWHSSQELEDSVAKLEKLPMTIGDWRSVKMELDEREMKMASIVGSAYRRYENPKTGAAVTMFLVSGRPGPISVHSPEVCYPGNGFVQQAAREEVAVGDDKFWAIKLSKTTALARSNIVVYFGWNADGTWKAPEGDPRLVFATFPVLYKMYIIHEQRGAEFKVVDGDGMAFAKDILPTLKTALFGNPQG